MKIILSRKGFDSSNGGMPSPILNKDMLSMPIPSDSKYTYSDLKYGDKSYLSILQSLNSKFTNTNCHLDPDIRSDVLAIEGWKPAYGQINASQTHLRSKNVGIGDIFLFFGWFRETEYVNGKIKFKKGSLDIQAIYGYLQVGKIISGRDIKEYYWHPHANDSYIKSKSNTLYIPSENLEIDGVETGLPSYGTLKYSPNCILTKDGYSRSKWAILDWFDQVEISYHTKKSIKDEYFQSAYIGQEFVVSENSLVTKWAKKVIYGEEPFTA